MEEFSVIRAVRLWFFVIALAFFIIIGSIAVHEIGHAVVAMIAGCSVESILLFSPQSNPATYISCSSETSQIFVSMAGITFNILLGIIFLFSDKPLVNNISYMFFGFGLYSGKMDLQSMGFPVLIASLVSLIGIIIIVYALYLFCKTETLELFRTKKQAAEV